MLQSSADIERSPTSSLVEILRQNSLSVDRVRRTAAAVGGVLLLVRHCARSCGHTRARIRGPWCFPPLIARRLIGIGGHLAAPPLPHHRAYGSVPRRFDRVKRWPMSPREEGRSSRRRRWAEPAGLPHGEPCARTHAPTRQLPPHESGTRPAGAIARTECA